MELHLSLVCANGLHFWQAKLALLHGLPSLLVDGIDDVLRGDTAQRTAASAGVPLDQSSTLDLPSNVVCNMQNMTMLHANSSSSTGRVALVSRTKTRIVPAKDFAFLACPLGDGELADCLQGGRHGLSLGYASLVNRLLLLLFPVKQPARAYFCDRVCQRAPVCTCLEAWAAVKHRQTGAELHCSRRTLGSCQ